MAVLIAVTFDVATNCCSYCCCLMLVIADEVSNVDIDLSELTFSLIKLASQPFCINKDVQDAEIPFTKQKS